MGELAKESSIEIWKPIIGFENYMVSNYGNVKSLNYNQTGKEQLLKQRLNKGGYLVIGLNKNGKYHSFLVHRLVAEAFIPNDDPEHKTQCNHISENKLDCRAINLNWMTPKENTNWGTCVERRNKSNTNGKKSKSVVQKNIDGVIINIWPSIAEAGRNGFSRGHISACCKKKIWS